MSCCWNQDSVCVFAAFEKLLQTFKEFSLKVIHPWSNTNYHHSYMLCCMVGNVKITRFIRFIIHTGFSFFLIFYLLPSLFCNTHKFSVGIYFFIFELLYFLFKDLCCKKTSYGKTTIICRWCRKFAQTLLQMEKAENLSARNNLCVSQCLE